ncbi:HpcH/HpaI aldolase/citrate lyase family protein [Aquitalea sp. ASV15]|uniref:HpcH/HpaI aldolase family protein n=1 Tax=Aquitalea sp. ASV15 TaxID=2795104 RepID=UPI0018EBB996|nr:HpcH/HpaI aldolase/citrate lyase family protein [Aquitalea sp. ASV15]
MQLNPFKSALGQLPSSVPLYGIWAGTASSYVAEILATTGHDWILLDGEHAPNTLADLLPQLQAVAAYPVHPVLRIPSHDPVLIKQVLDIGAQTLMVPMVETAAQAAALVRAMHYPPAGSRGVGGGLIRAARWDAVPDYIRQAAQSLCLVVQIESPLGVANAAQIAAVDGVDAIFIGPADLSTSMGHAGDASHADVQHGIRHTIACCLEQGKACGILAPNEQDARRYAEWGCSFMAISIDIPLLRQAALASLARFRACPGPLGSSHAY